jgi:hypothetical protein
MIILFLYNLSVYSSEGRQAIHDATTNELLVVLATIESNLKKQLDARELESRPHGQGIGRQ